MMARHRHFTALGNYGLAVWLAQCALMSVVVQAGIFSLRTQGPSALPLARKCTLGQTTLGASDEILLLIRRLPKAELHIHIEGTLEPELMMQLATKNNVSLPYYSLEEAKAARQHYSNLQEFLDAYQLGLSVLVTEHDFRELAVAYLEQAAKQNITHVEIFFDPQSHIRRGVPLSRVMAGLQSAIAARRSHPTHPIDATLILCLVRNLGADAAVQILTSSRPYLSHIAALGLASTEVGYPPIVFKGVYQAATKLGLHRVAHAGEEGGPDYVWGAINELKVQRVDHGIHSLDDTDLVHYMAQHKLPITLCPVSNVQLKVYGEALPQKLCDMMGSGILVTINSDDPAYFGAYLNDNYNFIAGLANLSPAEVAQLAKNSFEASFINRKQKREAFRKIDKVLADWQAEQMEQVAAS